jgi:hypothetical protein
MAKSFTMRMPDWKNDRPHHDELKLRHLHMECMPSFDALRQYEWVRSSGKFNMITEGRAAADEMMKLGFFDALEWIIRCQEEQVFFGTVYSTGMDHWKKEIPGNWFDKEFLQGIQLSKKRDLKDQMRKLEAEMADLESK